jgi:hypothetical protein
MAFAAKPPDFLVRGGANFRWFQVAIPLGMPFFSYFWFQRLKVIHALNAFPSRTKRTTCPEPKTVCRRGLPFMAITTNPPN